LKKKATLAVKKLDMIRKAPAMEVSRKRPVSRRRDVLIVILCREQPRRDVLVSLVDLWLARELAQQIAKEIMARRSGPVPASKQTFSEPTISLISSPASRR